LDIGSVAGEQLQRQMVSEERGSIMELHDIRYFLALSKTLTFTKAAEACNVSQPALTCAIQTMEDELGGLLFSRERNNTHLTDLGRLLEPHMTEVLARIQVARETATRFLRLDSAQLRPDVMCTIGPVRFVSFLSRFRAENPGVEVTFVEAVPDRLCDLLMKVELDVTLLAKPNGFAAPLQRQPPYKERLVIACSAGHESARKNAVRLADMDGQPYLARIDCEDFDLLRARRLDPDDGGSQHVIEPSVAHEVSLVTVAGRRWSSPLSAFVRAARQYQWPEPAQTGGPMAEAA
jgi:DNA-binding transcriptional LysR family regulator